MFVLVVGDNDSARIDRVAKCIAQEAASAAVSALRLHIDEFRVTYETVCVGWGLGCWYV